MRAITSRGSDQGARYLPDGRILYYRGSAHVWVVANADGTHIPQAQGFTSSGPRCAYCRTGIESR